MLRGAGRWPSVLAFHFTRKIPAFRPLPNSPTGSGLPNTAQKAAGCWSTCRTGWGVQREARRSRLRRARPSQTPLPEGSAEPPRRVRACRTGSESRDQHELLVLLHKCLCARTHVSLETHARTLLNRYRHVDTHADADSRACADRCIYTERFLEAMTPQQRSDLGVFRLSSSREAGGPGRRVCFTAGGEKSELS